MRRRKRRLSLLGLDLRRLLLNQANDVVDHVGIADMMISDPGQIDHMRTVAAAGDPDVGLTRFARPVDDAAKDAERHRRLDMLQSGLECLDGADDIKALSRTTRA